MKIVFIITFLNVLVAYGQNLKGKWSLINDNFTITIPEGTIIEFTEKELITYSFDSIYSKVPIRMDSNEKIFYEKSTKEYKYSFDDSITLVNYHKGTLNTENGIREVIAESKYVKILSTKVNFPIKKIFNNQYNHFYSTPFQNENERKILFNKEMCLDTKIKAKFDNKKCERYVLKKIDSTYFIVYYWNGNDSKWMIPIKEINEDHLIIYGVAGIDGFIKLQKIFP